MFGLRLGGVRRYEGHKLESTDERSDDERGSSRRHDTTSAWREEDGPGTSESQRTRPGEKRREGETWSEVYKFERKKAGRLKVMWSLRARRSGWLSPGPRAAQLALLRAARSSLRRDHTVPPSFLLTVLNTPESTSSPIVPRSLFLWRACPAVTLDWLLSAPTDGSRLSTTSPKSRGTRPAYKTTSMYAPDVDESRLPWWWVPAWSPWRDVASSHQGTYARSPIGDIDGYQLPLERHAQGPSDWPRLSIWSVKGSAQRAPCAVCLSHFPLMYATPSN